MNEIILIPFSGGLDSTYLMYENLLLGKIIQPLYIEIFKINEAKAIIEKNQIIKILNILSKKFPEQILPISIIQVFIDTNSTQSLMWLKGIKQFLNSKNNKISEIHIGYIMDDLDEYSPMSFFVKFKKRIKSETKTKVQFPLINKHKKDIYKILPDYLKELIYSCEFPLYSSDLDFTTITTCEKCHPCILDKKINITKSNTFQLDTKIDYSSIHSFNEISETCAGKLGF